MSQVYQVCLGVELSYVTIAAGQRMFVAGLERLGIGLVSPKSWVNVGNAECRYETVASQTTLAQCGNTLVVRQREKRRRSTGNRCGLGTNRFGDNLGYARISVTLQWFKPGV